jgi:hypothetical protein
MIVNSASLRWRFLGIRPPRYESAVLAPPAEI